MLKDTKNLLREHLDSSFPQLAKTHDLSALIAEQLISPFVLSLPLNVLAQIQSAVKALAELKKHVTTPGPLSMMNSYDFHLNEVGQLKLIEVNTNAAFLILSHHMYKMFSIKPVVEYDDQVFVSDIKNELHLWSQQTNQKQDHLHVSLVDHQPAQQKLYIEFLVAQEWLRKNNISCDLRDTKDAMLAPQPTFIYNRDTDFFLERPEVQALKQAYQRQQICLSPHPEEYRNFAHKKNLIQWSQPGFLDRYPLSEESQKILREIIPASYDLQTMSADEMWSQRKKLFFKPQSEYGSKKAFKGASVSRKVFDELCQVDLMAQEYIAAPEQTFETPTGSQTFKYDLRCHVYGDRLEGVCARLYQGQVTNLKTLHGGFAPVVFV